MSTYECVQVSAVEVSCDEQKKLVGQGQDGHACRKRLEVIETRGRKEDYSSMGRRPHSKEAKRV